MTKLSVQEGEFVVLHKESIRRMTPIKHICIKKLGPPINQNNGNHHLSQMYEGCHLASFRRQEVNVQQ